MVMHRCDKAPIIAEHGTAIARLAQTVEESTGRIAEMETTLFGASRNGQGFIKDTRETLEIVRTGLNSMADEIRDIRTSIKLMRGARAWVKVTLPPLIVGVASVAAVVLAK